MNFLYLVQSPDGVFTAPPKGRDVLSLTFKTPREDAIFLPGSTWTTGRNALLAAALQRQPYDYYIFMDDDILWTAGGFEQFEKQLTEHAPVFAGAVMVGYNTPETAEQPSPTCVVTYDALYNAFHHEAVRHLLPYLTEFDRDSWWASQSILLHKLNIMYRGRTALFTDCVIRNEQHRQYPRNHQRKKIDDWTYAHTPKTDLTDDRFIYLNRQCFDAHTAYTKPLHYQPDIHMPMLDARHHNREPATPRIGRPSHIRV